jgi:hypothetical protein
MAVGISVLNHAAALHRLEASASSGAGSAGPAGGVLASASHQQRAEAAVTESQPLRRRTSSLDAGERII